MDKYGNTFDFKIFNVLEGDQEWWEFEFAKGKVKKHLMMRWNEIPLSNNKCKRILKRIDCLNGSTQIVKEEIYSSESEVSISKIEKFDEAYKKVPWHLSMPER